MSSLSVLIVAPTPPPFHGVAVATQSVLKASVAGRLSLLHLDIADRRGIAHVDKPDLHDVLLFCRQWFRLAGILATRRPQVVYLAISQSTVGFTRDALFLGLAYLFRRRVVLHLHGGNFARWFAGRPRALQRFVRAVLAPASRFIVLASEFRDSLRSIVNAERIVVVPNGIAWDGAERIRGQEARARRHRVLFLSTLSEDKGALLLLEAAAQVLNQRRDVEFVLAGPWARSRDEQRAAELIAKYGLREFVSLPGQVDGHAKTSLYESADVFVFPGIQQEGQPLVVLEAMAAGLPVVFSDRGCLAETVREGEAGVHFRRGDAHELAERLLTLLARPELMQRLGVNARRRYEVHYSEQRFISNMRRVFLEAAREGE
jgi:glycosyltransferase involved in cell wall biosynthesis